MLPSLNVKIGADTAGLADGLANAEREVSAFARGTQRAASRIQNFGNQMTKIGARLSVVSAAFATTGAAAFAMVNSTAQAGQEIGNLSRLANTTAEDFQRLAAGARTVGINQEKLADILKDVNDRVGDFNSTGAGPMADFFENIAPKVGVTADQFARLSGPEALQLYVDSLNEAGLSQADMTFYLEAMASDASALIPLLANGGAEMRRLGDAAEEAGAIMDEDAIAASRRFNETLLTLQDGLRGAMQQISVALMPALTDLMQSVNDHVIPAIVSMAGSIADLIEWFGNLPGPVQEAAAIIGTTLGVAGPIMLALGVLSKAFAAIIAATGPIGLFIAAATLAYTAWQVWGDEIKAAIGGAIDWVAEKFDFILGKISAFVQGIKDAAQSVKDFFASIPGMLPAGGGGVVSGEITPEAMAGQGLSEGQIGEIMDADPRERGAMLGRMVGTGFQEGLTSTLDANSEAIRLYLQQIEQEARDQLEIKSPSRVFADIGNRIGEGLAVGIEESTSLVQSALDGMIGSAVGNVKGGVSDILSGLGSLFQGSKEISAGIALANSFLAFTEVLKDPSFVGNPLGRFAAASAALSSGLAAVQSIKSAQKGGNTGGGGASSAAGSAPAMPTQNIMIDLAGATPQQTDQFRQLAETFQGAIRAGYLPNVMIASGGRA